MLLFYLYIKNNKLEEAISLLSIIEAYQYKIYNEYTKKNKNLEKEKKLLKKIDFITMFLEKKLKKKESEFQKIAEELYKKKIDFMIKKFLQEKGL